MSQDRTIIHVVDLTTPAYEGGSHDKARKRNEMLRKMLLDQTKLEQLPHLAILRFSNRNLSELADHFARLATSMNVVEKKWPIVVYWKGNVNTFWRWASAIEWDYGVLLIPLEKVDATTFRL